MFSELKRVKINFHCYLGVKLLKNILKIMEEGAVEKLLSQWTAIKKCSIDNLGTQCRRNDHVATSHVILPKWLLNLSVMVTVKITKKAILKIGSKKDICFLLIPNKIIFLVAKWAVDNCHVALKDFNFLSKYVVFFLSS